MITDLGEITVRQLADAMKHVQAGDWLSFDIVPEDESLFQRMLEAVGQDHNGGEDDLGTQLREDS